MLLQIEKCNARVYVQCDDRNADAYSSFLRPFVSVSRVLRRPPESWVVYSGRQLPSLPEQLQHAEYESPIKDEPSCCFSYNLENRAVVVRHPTNGEWHTQVVLRIARTLLRMQLWRRGFVFLHGGMVSIDGVGLVILGRKMSGKTATILTVLRQANSGFVSNDDVALNESDSSWTGFGWPRGIKVWDDTLSIVLGNARNVKGLLSHPANSLTMERRLSSGKVIRAVFLYCHDLPLMFKCDLKSSADVNILLFPRFVKKEEKQSSVSRLDPNLALNRLMENVVSNPGKQNDFLLPAFSPPGTEETLRRLTTLTRRIPAYELVQSHESILDSASQLNRIAQTCRSVSRSEHLETS